MEQANNIFQFKKLIDRYKMNNEFTFRGQSAKYENITASIARDIGYIENEYKIYAESIELKPREFEHLSSPIQSLAKLQHYGIPTRLIDVTEDPYIALFFAVQDTSKDDGYVYFYCQKTHELKSKKVNLLSLLATLGDYTLENIQKKYQQIFKDTITEKEILTLAAETAFVKQSEKLRELNPRLYNQKGTFAICGNMVEGDNIHRKIRTLDSIEPSIVIKVPYEYKAQVKRELDVKYGINETYIYPELPSVSNYIKEKYRYTNFNSKGMYTVIEESDISHAGASRISLMIVLNEPLNIDEIKQVSIDLMRKKSQNDVVWIYVARNGNDYIMRNWILTGQWINRSLDETYKPLPIGEMDDEGYCWKKANDYSVLSDYYEENIFGDDKKLFVENHAYYEELRHLFKYLQRIFIEQNTDLFKKEVKNYTSQINKYHMAYSDLGHSKDRDFDDFLHNFQEFISIISDIPLWVKREDLNNKAWNYQIEECFKDANKLVELIDSKSEFWKRKLNIPEDAIEKFKNSNP
ncbi:FRG domain-containing protein [Virgibacillus oceani]|uniref:FRG domain-containing protein n=1 Tax=Virgibacillus oceani TaxID=1479511 RepID=A0A917GYK3_9BACI|nr:FRG domain-containing protein [Virgibacillus oceani]GGG61447.1 hypothetical protein GCM10011398_00930 [Virgibacillus oceani]